jgi:hypothetical protein
MYLGGKLNHTEKTVEKAKRKLNVLKRPARTKWGISRSIECHIQIYIKSVLQYGCEALVTATPTTLNKLEVI